MKIYLISQTVNTGYDTYDSAVVIAEDEEEAKRICPEKYYKCGKDDHWFFQYSDGGEKDEGLCPNWFDWCAVKDVKVEYIGEAKNGSKKGVVCASFNAG